MAWIVLQDFVDSHPRSPLLIQYPLANHILVVSARQLIPNLPSNKSISYQSLVRGLRLRGVCRLAVSAGGYIVDRLKGQTQCRFDLKIVRWTTIVGRSDGVLTLFRSDLRCLIC
jgi:hypothetical protein